MKRIKVQSRVWFLVSGILPIALLFGCAVGPNYKRPQTSVANSFANAPTNIVSPEEAALATWWKGFNDARLDRLVERAIANNHDLRIATANLKESRAQRRFVTFDLAPTVVGNAGYANSLRSPGRTLRRQLRRNLGTRFFRACPPLCASRQCPGWLG
jgi:outer membrane protein TolC